LFARKVLDSNWKFKLAESSYSTESISNQKIKPEKWFTATVPGTIHTDLLSNNLIKDPFYSDNELKLNWINKCDWIYQTEFDFKNDNMNNVDMVFEGLDTICEIYLNNVKLGDTDNMFLSHRYDVKKILKSSDNLLKLIFRSPLNYTSEQEEKYGKLPVALNSSRVYIRKAQYSFGWDWGPSFPTSGIWRNVYLEEYADLRIENVTFHITKLNDDLAEVDVVTEINGNQSNNLSIHISISNGQNIYEKKITIGNSTKFNTIFEIKNPKLWWPNGEGEQNLYSLSAKIIDNNKFVLDEINKNVGIRKLELILTEEGKSSFKFRINNRDIYCHGVNWIPADSFLPRITKEKYSELLSFAKQANINIVRVWGGGVYEDDEFYSLCDKFGLLVWQDFMFACGSYPEHESFIKNVKKEIVQNVLRLQHHPSLALWCGNNENEWIWYQEQKTSYKKMPGYKIYHFILPEILNEIDPGRPYWPSSPFGNEEDPNSFYSGNNHQWDLWSRWIDYNSVVNDKSLFVTEFGFQGPANKSTFEKYLPVKNRKIQDKVFEFHNKQVEGSERLIRFLAGQLPINTNWSDFIYLAQLNQAFALKTCLEYWKFQSTKTNGSIIWQLNDCWPVTSWSLIDSDIRPKLAYYFVKNTFAPRLLYFKDEGSKIKVILFNQAKDKIKGRMRLTVINTVSREIIKDSYSKVNIDPKKLTEINSIVREKLPREENWILTAVLYNESNNIICRNYYLTKPWKHIRLKKTKLKLNALTKDNSTELILKSNDPVFFVDLYHPNLTFSDRGFFILPGEQIKLKVIGKQIKSLNVKDIKIYSLNSYLQD
jgi:beta-mannosidase